MSEADDLPGALGTAIESLEAAGSVPPTAAWEYLVDWEGEEATEALLDVMHGGGQAAIHAVRILAERGDPESIAPMIELLVEGDVEKLMRDEITFAFHSFGETALEPILEAHEEAHAAGDPAAGLTLLEAAFETGGHTRRMSEALARQVAHDPAIVRRMLPEYEATDEVIALLEERAAEIPDLEGDQRPEGEAIQAIWNTIEQLGGEIPEALRREMQPTPDDAPKNEAEAYITGDLGS